ncbi:MAG: ATPase [Deltaproteobacteria bacterium]|nr:ATPase [Candidatus Zymogenaceae bacterium]
MKFKKVIVGLIALNALIFFTAAGVGLLVSLVPDVSYGFQDGTDTGGGHAAPESAPLGDSAVGWGFVAAALSTGIAALGAGVAVGGVGSAAMGAISERPELLGRAMIFVGLAEGIAIYGLIISIMILGQL